MTLKRDIFQTVRNYCAITQIWVSTHNQNQTTAIYLFLRETNKGNVEIGHLVSKWSSTVITALHPKLDSATDSQQSLKFTNRILHPIQLNIEKNELKAFSVQIWCVQPNILMQNERRWIQRKSWNWDTSQNEKGNGECDKSIKELEAEESRKMEKFRWGEKECLYDS